MKIAGGMNYIKFDLENGYVIKAEGEMLVGRKFVVYTDTMKTWEPPHENEKISKEQIERIIREVQKSMSENTVQITFEQMTNFFREDGKQHAVFHNPQRRSDRGMAGLMENFNDMSMNEKIKVCVEVACDIVLAYKSVKDLINVVKTAKNARKTAEALEKTGLRRLKFI